MLHVHENSLAEGLVPLRAGVIDDDCAMRLSLDSVLRLVAHEVGLFVSGAEVLTRPFRNQDILDAIGRAVEREPARLQADKRRTFVRRLIDSHSPGEQEVFSLLCHGQPGKQIAHRLAIAEATGKVHRRNIMAKLGATRISQLFEIHRFLADGDG